MSLEFKRLFTQNTESNPYAGINFVSKIAQISQGDKILFQREVVFPDFWSQTAINITASKYFYGDKNSKPEMETDVRHMIDRVVDWITNQGIKQNYFNTDNAKIFNDELKYALIHQMVSFNSPVWFNIGNPFSEPQISACFIISALDDMENILDNVKTEGMIFKYGSGSGSNRSKLRSSREKISGGGKASGPNSFMKIYDATAQQVKSGGKTRRAAKMEILDIDHGDIIEFINQKSDEENKAKALIKAGWPSFYDDPKGAYSSVFFQNSNQSVSLSDVFMKCVENDELWALIERRPQIYNGIDSSRDTSQGHFVRCYGSDYYLVNNDKEGTGYKVIEWISARKLFNIIAQKAWETGDPGVQFNDTMNAWHTCPASDRINATNPCSEYVFIDDTSCNLASLNLLKFLINNEFQIEWFESIINLMITAMDIFIDAAHYPTEKIAIETRKYRTLGLGYSNLGALLMAKGLPYDSYNGRDYARSVTALMHSTAYKQSWKIADILGPFSEFKKNKDHFARIIQKHNEFTNELIENITVNDNNTDIEKIKIAAATNMNAVNRAKDLNIRNAQVTVIAPTGTISFMMDCDTTGVEPMLGLVQYKSLAGGGMIKIVPKVVKFALEKTNNYTDKEIDLILEEISKGTSVKNISYIKVSDLPLLQTSLDKDNMISYRAHIKMMAAIQPFLSGAISKTVNMPNEATVKDVEDVYIESWRLGIKCVAIYRDGCKLSQPLNVKEKSEISEPAVIKENIIQNKLSNGRPKPIRKPMTQIRKSITHKFNIAGHSGYFTIGLYDNGEPGEIFISMKEGSTIAGLLDGWAINFSIALQYGVPLQSLVDKAANTRFEPAGFTGYPDIPSCTSILDYIARFFTFYFINKTKPLFENTDSVEALLSSPENKITNKLIYSGEICRNCGSETIRSGSCNVCPNCGETTGCG